jgi:hypothetical protein
MSFWEGVKHTHTDSLYKQLWLLDGGFKRDTFVYYTSWREDDAIVYRITTTNASASKFFSFFTPVKANYVFLKIQLSTPNEAYNALEDKAPKSMLPPNDFKHSLQDKNWVTANPLSDGFSGNYIRTFVDRNESSILIEKREFNTMRVYTIVWAPNGEQCRLKGMDKFIWKVLGGELNIDKWSKFGSAAISVTTGGGS